MRVLPLALSLCVALFAVGCAGDRTESGATGAGTPGAGAPAPPSGTRSSEGADLVDRLRRGGYVLYVRHAATEATQDDATPDLDDPGTQRNLSAAGRADAREIGRAVSRLNIPIGRVLASPYRRTVETAELAFGKGRVEESRDIINEVYPGTDDDALARGLRRLLSQRPAGGENTVLVSHGFNLSEATGLAAAEGETVVFDPGGGKPLTPVGRIGVDDWRALTGGR